MKNQRKALLFSLFYLLRLSLTAFLFMTIRNNAIGGLSTNGENDTHTLFVDSLLARTIAIKNNGDMMRSMAILAYELPDKRIAGSPNILHVQSMKSRVAFNHIIAINKNLTSHNKLAYFLKSC